MFKGVSILFKSRRNEMTGEGTPVKKIVSRYHSKKWRRRNDQIEFLNYMVISNIER